MKRLLDLAAGEIGYLEKASNANLDSKTANAGFNNFTKYWRDIASGMNGQAWCDCFISWIFWKTYGAAEADRLLCGGLHSFYTPTSAGFFKSAGRWVTDPKPGDVIYFANTQRIYHTGLVIASDDKTVTTIEGNTSATMGVDPNGGGVWQKKYSINEPKIAGYGRPAYKEEKVAITVTQFINAVKAVCTKAKNEHWRYGNSQALPPCADGIISCDRMVARALYDLGFKSQPKGGITVLNMEQFLLKWGFKKISSKSSLKKGDIILFKQDGTSSPTAFWHTFVITAYDANKQICSKYDEGSQPRIDAGGFFANVALDEWNDKSFYCAFRLPSSPSKKQETYTKVLRAVYYGQKGSHVRLLQKLLKYANCKGKDGKVLEVTGKCGDNTVHAINVYQTRKRKAGVELGTNGKNDGICGSKMWQELVG